MAIRPEKQTIVMESINEINEGFSEMGLTIEEAETILQGASRYLQQVRLAASNNVLCPTLKPELEPAEPKMEGKEDEDIRFLNKPDSKTEAKK
jgi:hypothetical protein